MKSERSAGTGIGKPRNVPEYRIVKEEGFDFVGCVRRGYRVVVEREASKGDVDQSHGLSIRVTGDQYSTSRAGLEAIAWDIIHEKTKTTPMNAISIFFYLPGTDADGIFTAGRAEWCPNGEWGEADSVETGNYSKHKLVITVGGALGKLPAGTVVYSIPEAKRREIFRALVEAEDSPVGYAAPYRVIAERYKVSEDTVVKITAEGVYKGWPEK